MKPTHLIEQFEETAPPENAGLGGVHLSPEALSFCLAKGLRPELIVALDAARRFFSIIGNPVVELLAGPETADTFYLIIELRVRGSVKENVIAHRKSANETAKLLGSRREIISLHYEII